MIGKQREKEVEETQGMAKRRQGKVNQNWTMPGKAREEQKKEKGNAGQGKKGNSKERHGRGRLC